MHYAVRGGAESSARAPGWAKGGGGLVCERCCDAYSVSDVRIWLFGAVCCFVDLTIVSAGCMALMTEPDAVNSTRQGI